MLEEFPEKPKGMHWRTYERMPYAGLGRRPDHCYDSGLAAEIEADISFLPCPSASNDLPNRASIASHAVRIRASMSDKMCQSGQASL
jgi:hypothetical protein